MHQVLDVYRKYATLYGLPMYCISNIKGSAFVLKISWHLYTWFLCVSWVFSIKTNSFRPRKWYEKKVSLKFKKGITANPCTFSNKQLYRTKIGEAKALQNIHSSKKKKRKFLQQFLFLLSYSIRRWIRFILHQLRNYTECRCQSLW